MAQETSFDVSWAFFFVCFASFSLFACRLVVPLSPAVPSFRLAWWRRCRCLAVLQWYPFPPREQLLAAVGISMYMIYILKKKISWLVDKTKKKRRKNIQTTWTSFGPLLCCCCGLMWRDEVDVQHSSCDVLRVGWKYLRVNNCNTDGNPPFLGWKKWMESIPCDCLHEGSLEWLTSCIMHTCQQDEIQPVVV